MSLLPLCLFLTVHCFSVCLSCLELSSSVWWPLAISLPYLRMTLKSWLCTGRACWLVCSLYSEWAGTQPFLLRGPQISGAPGLFDWTTEFPERNSPISHLGCISSAARAWGAILLSNMQSLLKALVCSMHLIPPELCLASLTLKPLWVSLSTCQTTYLLLEGGKEAFRWFRGRLEAIYILFHRLWINTHYFSHPPLPLPLEVSSIPEIFRGSVKWICLLLVGFLPWNHLGSLLSICFTVSKLLHSFLDFYGLLEYCVYVCMCTFRFCLFFIASLFSGLSEGSEGKCVGWSCCFTRNPLY